MKNSAYNKILSLEPYLHVALGGGAGATARYVLFSILPDPYSTLAVNIAGTFLLGFIMYEEIYIGALSAQSRILIAAGVLGSFTTFSAFIYDALKFNFVSSITYTVVSLTLGLASIYAGRMCALYLARRD